MTETMPDFEQTTVPPANEYPKPKKPRRKPTRLRKIAPARQAKTAVPKKRKVAKRRGRPAGVPNKPKPLEVRAPYAHHAFSAETYAAIRHLMAMEPAARNLAIGIVQGLAK